ncbi:MAG: PAS domain S-box protein [Cyanobacteriota bacterium]|nr:PAS domain S-box protein [Cyanobacteriota bacterium]
MPASSPQAIPEVEWLELALSSGRAGVWNYCISTDTWHWSKSCASLFGVPHEAIASNWNQFLEGVFPPDRERVAQHQRQIIENRTNEYSIEFRLLLSDETCRWVLQRGRFGDRVSDREPYLSGFIEDIDHRKRLETALRDREQHYQQILDAIADLVLVKGPHSEIVWANRAFRDYYGTTNEQLRNSIDASFNKPDYTARYLQDDAYVFYTGKTLTIPEEPVTRYDGKVQLFQTVKSAIRNSEGQVVMTVGVSRDLSEYKAAEVALAQSEAKFRDLVENANDFIYMSTLDGIFTYVSPKMIEVSGYDESELVGQSFVEFVHPDDLPACAAYTQQMFDAQQAVKEVEFRSRRKDGSWFWLAANTSICKDELGKIVGLQGIAREISDRKALEQKLAEQQELLETFVSASPVGIAIFDSDLRFVQINETLARPISRAEGRGQRAEGKGQWAVGSGQGAEGKEGKVQGDKGGGNKGNSGERNTHPHWVSDCLGKTLGEVVSPDQVESLESSILHVFETGKPVLGVEITGKVPEKSGKVWTHLASYFPLCWREGQLQLVGVVTYDISDRKHAEEARARLTAILESTSDFVGIADMEGRHLYMNQAGRGLCEIPPEEDISEYYIAEMLPEKAKAKVLQQGIPNALRDGTWQGETAILSRSGQEIPVSQVIISHKAANGTPQYLSTIVRDIRDRKAAEDRMRQQTQELERTLHQLRKTQAQLVQIEKMSSLGQLVAGIAHEINNPINFIHGNLVHTDQYVRELLGLLALYQQAYPQPVPEIEAEAEALDIDFLVEDLSKLLSSMKMGSDRIRQIVLSLRNFSRLDEAEMKPVDLHEGLDSSLLVLQHRLKAKSNCPEIQLLRDYGNLPPVECYAGQLNQAVVNLLANAIDALEDASLTEPPQIRLRTRATANNWVEIAIADNGSGIPEAIQNKLFDPFFTTKPVGKGTGLGLSICYQIVVEKHGGHLSCISSSGRGTEFIIEIPIVGNPQK